MKCSMRVDKTYHSHARDVRTISASPKLTPSTNPAYSYAAGRYQKQPRALPDPTHPTLTLPSMAASPEGPTPVERPVAYKYSPLPSLPNSIRLLRLLSANQANDPIKCQLFTYSLTSPPRTSHLYECLSYVWGDVKDKPLIEVDGAGLAITKNLHGALQRLRDPALDRVLWVDAVCINQDNIAERAQQVQVMAMIYAYASKVVVWLGEEVEGSSEAMEVLREEAYRVYRRQKTLEEANDGKGFPMRRGGNDLFDQAEANDNKEARENARDHVMTLLQRPWFRRIWVR